MPCSGVGTVSTAPARMRFMLSSMNACGLLRYSATSIWSSGHSGLDLNGETGDPIHAIAVITCVQRSSRFAQSSA